MTTIEVKPKVFTNYTLKIGADNYEAHVAEVTLTPSASVVTRRGASPTAKFQGITEASWALGLDVTQDWETPNSLSLFLLQHEGEEKTIVFSPVERATGPKFTVTALITPGTIGGAIDTIGASPVTLPVQGKPSFAAATAAV